MIVISTYNPQTQRTTEDEELLTTLLTSIVQFRAICDRAKDIAITETQKEFYYRQVRNCDTVIALVYPLLGLEFTEVYEIIKREGK